ncbi:JAB domain-containing protein [Geobacillus stearothermophilus]|uniref:JAB domain-containing protein n=1 Tax=Geobacillus stearothermophilus TaxID=1422 RepID=UPI00399D1740
MNYAQKYPTKRYLKFERIVKEKVDAGYYHIPEAIRSPEDAVDTVCSVLGVHRETQEVFIVALLNTKNKVIGLEEVHRGSANASIVSPRDVFKMALVRNAVRIMCFHNHPSGDPMPSREDIEVTKRLKEAGEILGVELLDHIIIGDEETYVSLRERGVI